MRIKDTHFLIVALISLTIAVVVKCWPQPQPRPLPPKPKQPRIVHIVRWLIEKD